MEFNNNNNNNISNDGYESQILKHKRKKIKNSVEEGFISNIFNSNIIEGNSNKETKYNSIEEKKIVLKQY